MQSADDVQFRNAKPQGLARLLDNLLGGELEAVGVALFLAGGWLSSRNEVSQLRVLIASLKRQLARNQTLN